MCKLLSTKPYRSGNTYFSVEQVTKQTEKSNDV